MTYTLTTNTQCISCKQPFTSANVFSQLGCKETQISGMCEICFEGLFDEMEEE